MAQRCIMLKSGEKTDLKAQISPKNLSVEKYIKKKLQDTTTFCTFAP